MVLVSREIVELKVQQFVLPPSLIELGLSGVDQNGDQANAC